MNWRPIACSAFLAAASCAGGGGGTRDELPPFGEALKVSYFRSYPEHKTKKPEPTYRAVLSNSWKDRVGEGVRDPFPRAAPGKVFLGYLPDARAREIAEKLRSLGVERLRWRNPDDCKPQDYFAKATDPKESEFTRLFTVGTDKWQRTYYLRDNQPNLEIYEVFLRCERYLTPVIDANSILVTTRTPAIFQQDK